MKPWLAKARTIVATVAVTSTAWFIGSAIWLQHERTQWALEAAKPPARNIDERSADRGAGAAEAGTGSRLMIPVVGVGPENLSDTFTQARAGGARVHDAIDIMAPLGTPVVAAAAGEVEKLFVSVQGGKTIYVRSPDRRHIYYYAHLDGYAPGLAEKQRLRPGQRLGTVGFTGNASPAAPHLHFAIMRISPNEPWSAKGEQLNPFPLLTAH